jgi:hypothetical protein
LKPASRLATRSACNKPLPPLVCPNNTCKLPCSTHLASSQDTSLKLVDVECHSHHRVVCLFRVLKVLAQGNTQVASPHNKVDVVAQGPNNFLLTCTACQASSHPEHSTPKTTLNSWLPFSKQHNNKQQLLLGAEEDPLVALCKVFLACHQTWLVSKVFNLACQASLKVLDKVPWLDVVLKQLAQGNTLAVSLPNQQVVACPLRFLEWPQVLLMPL